MKLITVAACSFFTGRPYLDVFFNVMGISCRDACSGSFSVVNITGGEQPDTYLWNTSSTDNSVGGLPLGNYSVTVAEALGGRGTASATVSYAGDMYRGVTGMPPPTDSTVTITAPGPAFAGEVLRVISVAGKTVHVERMRGFRQPMFPPLRPACIQPSGWRPVALWEE